MAFSSLLVDYRYSQVKPQFTTQTEDGIYVVALRPDLLANMSL